jgi:hypothetical protein
MGHHSCDGAARLRVRTTPQPPDLQQRAADMPAAPTQQRGGRLLRDGRVEVPLRHRSCEQRAQALCKHLRLQLRLWLRLRLRLRLRRR